MHRGRYERLCEWQSEGWGSHRHGKRVDPRRVPRPREFFKRGREPVLVVHCRRPLARGRRQHVLFQVLLLAGRVRAGGCGVASTQAARASGCATHLAHVAARAIVFRIHHSAQPAAHSAQPLVSAARSRHEGAVALLPLRALAGGVGRDGGDGVAGVPSNHQAQMLSLVSRPRNRQDPQQVPLTQQRERLASATTQCAARRPSAHTSGERGTVTSAAFVTSAVG